MGQTDDVVVGEKNFAVYEGLSEALWIALKQTESAYWANDVRTLGVHLDVAYSAIKCAVDIYRDWVSEMLKEEKKSERV